MAVGSANHHHYHPATLAQYHGAHVPAFNMGTRCECQAGHILQEVVGDGPNSFGQSINYRLHYLLLGVSIQ